MTLSRKTHSAALRRPQSWGQNAGQSAGTSTIFSVAAAIFMLFWSTYSIAHDHGEHASDFENDCIVYAVDSHSGVKTAPAESKLFAPGGSAFAQSLPSQLILSDNACVKPNAARAPPFLSALLAK